jgi:hypothetical protein
VGYGDDLTFRMNCQTAAPMDLFSHRSLRGYSHLVILRHDIPIVLIFQEVSVSIK